jgi:hypothetical protein
MTRKRAQYTSANLFGTKQSNNVVAHGRVPGSLNCNRAIARSPHVRNRNTDFRVN